jgi:hypothetical protein
MAEAVWVRAVVDGSEFESVHTVRGGDGRRVSRTTACGVSETELDTQKGVFIFRAEIIVRVKGISAVGRFQSRASGPAHRLSGVCDVSQTTAGNAFTSSCRVIQR